MKQEAQDALDRWIALVDETIAYYNTHPYGYDDGFSECRYRTESGAMCAVGRCMTDDALDKYGDSRDTVIDLAEECTDNNLNEILRSGYQNIPVSVWLVIQKMHDRAAWADVAISPSERDATIYELKNVASRL